MSVSTIRRYIHDRRLPAYRVANERILRMKRQDIEALLNPVFDEVDKEAKTNFSS